MSTPNTLQKLVEALNLAVEQAEHKPGEWAGTGQSMGGICSPSEPFQIGQPFVQEAPWAHFSYKRDSWLAVAAVNALPQLLALVAENEKLRSVSTIQEAVACVFDMLKFAACNTSGEEWSEELEDLAEEVIEYSPQYKRQWLDICTLTAERNRLKAEVDALRKLPLVVANEYSQLLLTPDLSKAKAEKFQQRMNAAMEVDRRMADVPVDVTTK
jgi:hypothetical protein